MAKQSMGKSMGNRECEWIRVRLPLWVDNGDGTGRPAAQGEGGDLSARELAHIERHVAVCANCRDYRVSMADALGALAIAATQLPSGAEAPSLWPALESRIAGRFGEPGGRRPGPARIGDNRSDRPWGDLDAGRPLRQAWAHDSVREAMTGRSGRNTVSRRISSLIWKGSAVAAVVIGLVELSVVRRQWKSADAVIQANTMPLADPVVLPTAAVEPAAEPPERDSGEIAANQLQVAETEPVRPTEPAAPGVDAVPAPKSPPHTRFGFDLDHGTPMPPDSREPKPVY